MRETGEYYKLGDSTSFIPYSLSPKQPELNINKEILGLYGDACKVIGYLNEASKSLRNPKRFIKNYVIKEAMLSSAIEGINTTLLEIYTKPLSDNKISKDKQLVLNYRKALESALHTIQNEGMPITKRVILKAHEELLIQDPSAGNFRRQPVRVGELVPAPAHKIPDLMSDLEKYINNSSDLPPLIKAGLVHVQFETIHPLHDGNGRIGRLLIVLMLIKDNILTSPILYPSYYFKKNHLKYYEKLDLVRTHGNYEEWIIFFLTAIIDSAYDAYVRVTELDKFEQEVRNSIKSDSVFSKMRENALDILEQLFDQPIISIPEIKEKLNKPYNTIQNILNVFVKQELISENIINKRNKQYRFDKYLWLLERQLKSYII